MSHTIFVFEHTLQNQAVRDHQERHMTFMHKGKNTFCWNNGERLDVRTCGWNARWFRSCTSCVCSSRHCCNEDILVNDLNVSMIGISKLVNVGIIAINIYKTLTFVQMNVQNHKFNFANFTISNVLIRGWRAWKFKSCSSCLFSRRDWCNDRVMVNKILLFNVV